MPITTFPFAPGNIPRNSPICCLAVQVVFPCVEPTVLIKPGAFWLLSESEDPKIQKSLAFHLLLQPATVPRAGILGIPGSWIPSWPFCTGGSAEAGLCQPSSCRMIKSTLGSTKTTAGPRRGAVPPKTQLRPGLRAGDSPQGTQGQLLHPGKLRDPQRCRGAQLFPGTSPDLPGIQGPLLSSAAARARCEISPLEMLPARIYGFCSFPFMAPAGKCWRGMKGAARGGMAGEHFKGSRVALGYSRSFSSSHPQLPAASPSSSTALKPSGARVKHLQLSSGAGAALRSPQQGSHHPQILHPQTGKCQLRQGSSHKKTETPRER